MQEVSVIIPNFNGMAYLDGVLSGLECQTVRNFEVILVDNGSSDGSCAFVASSYPWVHMIELPENFGFCKAVNEGIKASRAPYVLLLNNDIEVTPDFIEEMLAAIRRHKKALEVTEVTVDGKAIDKELGVTFTNHYQAADTDFTVSVKKSIEGLSTDKAKGQSFTFDLYKSDETWVTGDTADDTVEVTIGDDGTGSA